MLRIDELPEELLREILSYLPRGDLLSVSRVSVGLYMLVHDICNCQLRKIFGRNPLDNLGQQFSTWLV